ncbi:MAG TPA: hypothetical protein VHZ96_23260 [Frankiaceae bacterium]|jgi:hypothetical protein|nr:hypothetical protein [Frankiaceae bacterium]
MIGDRWGVSGDEVARRYPCDDLVSDPVLQAWRGVSVQATPEVIWAWIGQIRLAPYSYDRIDNFGRRSPQELRDLPEPAPGQNFSASAGRPLGRIISVSPREHLTARIAGAFMSYVLVPRGSGESVTRLLLKVVMEGRRWTAPVISVGDLVMARRQLLNLKRLAETPTMAAL